jgi:hypothetical protein
MTTMIDDRLHERLVADAHHWRAARSEELDLDAAIARLESPRVGWTHRPARRTPMLASLAVVLAAAVGIGIFAAVRRSPLPSRAGPANLVTCGDAPGTTGHYPRGVTLRVIAPHTAKSATTIRPELELVSQHGRPRLIADAGSDIESYILSGGHIVGRYSGSIGGTGLGIRLGQTPIRLHTIPLLLSGCPTGAIDSAHPDANRVPLPPGRYQIVASLQSDKTGAWTMTTPPTAIQVVSP